MTFIILANNHLRDVFWLGEGIVENDFNCHVFSNFCLDFGTLVREGQVG